VARIHPVEMAEKRAIARAERFTFGTESFVDDEEVEDAVRVVLEEEKNPEHVRAQAARYDAIHEVDDDEPLERKASWGELWAEHRRLVAHLQALGMRSVRTLGVRATEDEIAAANAEMLERIENLETDQRLAREVDQAQETLV
jgi:hypothetical protein